MRFLGRETDLNTVDYPTEIQHVEGSGPDEITVYCSHGWYFTLTRSDVRKIAQEFLRMDTIQFRTERRKR